MREYHVPAVSLAIIDHGKIVYSHAYSINKKLTVTTHSRFQSASIGKSVTAYGALLLVDKGKVELDQNVNDYLKTWKIPENAYTTQYKVTLRNILDMTSGLSVSGFAGHFVHDPLPTLKQILNGESPAENQPVRVTFVPGSRYYYSGGSYEVLEQLIEDRTHSSFRKFMKKNVLQPLQMNHSEFIALPSRKLQQQTVPGFLKNGEMIPGQWKIIPALGAGGMWTTPTDLAKFAINVFQSFHGKKKGLLSQKLSHEMLTRQKNTDFGLGVIVDGERQTLNFRKEGHNIGFYNWLIAFPNTEQGAIVMTNSENGIPVIKGTIQAIAQLHKWPKHSPLIDESQRMPVNPSVT